MMDISLYTGIVDSALGFDLWVFVAHILAVTILLVIIVFFAWKPTKKYIKDRKKIIQEDINNIEKSKKIIENNLTESNNLKNKSIEEASKIIELAEINAYDLREKIKTEANLEAKHINDMAKNDIQKKEKELRKNINLEISNLAIEIAESLIEKNIDEKTNQKLIDKLINDIKKS